MIAARDEVALCAVERTRLGQKGSRQPVERSKGRVGHGEPLPNAWVIFNFVTWNSLAAFLDEYLFRAYVSL